MQGTKVLRLIRQFTATELDSFDQFLQSPYFNSNESVLKLYHYLLEFEEEQMSHEAAYAYIYPDKAFNYKGLNKLRSVLLKLGEEFIAIEALQKDDFAAQLYLLRFYEERTLFADCESELKKTKKKIEKEPIQDAEFFFQKFLLAKEEERLRSSRFQQFDYSLIADLDRYYVMQKMVYLCNSKNHANIHAKALEVDLTPNAVYDQFGIPNFQAWQSSLSLLSAAEKLPHFLALKSIVFEHSAAFSTNDLHNFCMYLQNNTVPLFPNKYECYLQLFTLYQFQLERGIFDDFNFNAGLFRNVASVAINLRKLDWLEQLMERYESQIRTFDNGLYELTMARIRFNQQSYEEAEDYLLEAENKASEIEKAFIYPLKIKLFHDTERDIEALTNSYKTFLHRLKSRLASNQKHIITRLRNFNNICVKIPRLHGLGSTEEQLAAIADLEAELYDTNKSIPEKEWLLETLENYLPRKFGTQLKKERTQLKTATSTLQLKAFEAFLESNKHHLTTAQLQANQAFCSLFSISETTQLEKEICHLPYLAERGYWLSHL